MLLQYIRFFELNNTLYTSTPNDQFSYLMYSTRLFVVSADCSVSLEDLRDRLPLLKRGEIKVEVRFKTPTTKPWTMLAFGQVPSLLAIGKNSMVEVSHPGAPSNP